MEHVIGLGEISFPISVSMIEDSSLRYGGQEFVTKPCTEEQALETHHILFNGGVEFDGNPCSHRGSIHVHVNFTDIDEEKVQQFIRLYALVEPLFFKVVAKERQNNIYCVPLSSTQMLYNLFTKSLEWNIEHWHKYCAFNIKRLGPSDAGNAIGTIEFRHFEITQDTAKFSLWLKMIRALYDFNLATEIDVFINPSQLYRLINAVGPTYYAYEDIYTEFSDVLVNDMLLAMNPTMNLLEQRLKQKELV